uniref:Uncharacterized protein n=1 Tax=Plectus sambesii TaxID=2011161 RepID=A0A914XPV5_9BILA
MGEAYLNLMEKLSIGTKNRQNKEMQMRKITLDGCIKKGKVCLSLIMKQLNGTEKLLSREMHMRKIISDFYTGMGEVCLNRMQILKIEKRENCGTSKR